MDDKVIDMRYELFKAHRTIKIYSKLPFIMVHDGISGKKIKNVCSYDVEDILKDNNINFNEERHKGLIYIRNFKRDFSYMKVLKKDAKKVMDIELYYDKYCKTKPDYFYCYGFNLSEKEIHEICNMQNSKKYLSDIIHYHVERFIEGLLQYPRNFAIRDEYFFNCIYKFSVEEKNDLLHDKCITTISNPLMATNEFELDKSHKSIDFTFYIPVKTNIQIDKENYDNE